MGMDMTVNVRGMVTHDQILQLKKRSRDLWPGNDPICEIELNHGLGAYQISSLWRLYSPGYARGHWPSIRMFLMLVMRTFPLAEVYHTDDCSESLGEIVDDDFFEVRDSLWLESDNQTYYQS